MIVPTKPTKTPINWFFLNENPNIVAPIIYALKGVSEFKIAEIELSISVIAKAKRKEGKNVPTKAV